MGVLPVELDQVKKLLATAVGRHRDVISDNDHLESLLKQLEQ